MKSIICWSGGKDSTATVILAKIHNIPIDKIIMSEVMFSHKDNISGEDSDHIDWVYDIAKPRIESWGYDVEVLRDKDDYLSLFNHKTYRSKVSQRNGKSKGVFLAGRCWGNGRLKMRPIRQFRKRHCTKETIEYLGICIDEPIRLEKMKNRNENAVSLLERFNYTQEMAKELCKEYDLLSPIYDSAINKRQGCWFCMNKSIAQFAELKQKEPDKWQLLLDMGKTPNLASYGFKWGKTIEQVDKEVNEYIKCRDEQITIFDLIKNKQ